MGFARSALHANPLTLDASLDCANAELDGATGAAIVAWALERAANPVLSTNFRPGAAAFIHLVTRARPGIPVIWVDTGYNTPATYRHVEALVARWKLNLHCYTPRVTVARRAAGAGMNCCGEGGETDGTTGTCQRDRRRSGCDGRDAD